MYILEDVRISIQCIKCILKGVNDPYKRTLRLLEDVYHPYMLTLCILEDVYNRFTVYTAYSGGCVKYVHSVHRVFWMMYTILTCIHYLF